MNQSRTVPVIPNHEERRDNKMLWSIVSNAAERSRLTVIDDDEDDISKVRIALDVICTSAVYLGLGQVR